MSRPLVAVIEEVACLRLMFAAPAFVEAALRGSAGFTFRVGGRQVAVQEVDSSNRQLRLALAEAGEGELFPADASRVAGIVDHGRAPETSKPNSEPAGDLDVLITRQHVGFLATAERLSRTGWLLFRGPVGILDRRLAVVGVLLVLLITTTG